MELDIKVLNQSQEKWSLQNSYRQGISKLYPTPLFIFISLDDNFVNVSWTLIQVHPTIHLGITFMLTFILVEKNTTLYSWCTDVICFDDSICNFISFTTRLQFQKIFLVDFSLPDIHILMIALHKLINKYTYV